MPLQIEVFTYVNDKIPQLLFMHTDLQWVSEQQSKVESHKPDVINK